MNKVFISYKTEDRDRARRVRQALAAATGLEVWWDQDLQCGGRWNQELDAALQGASCIVVLWSTRAVESPWVIQEAAIANVLNRLVPARLDACLLPAPFQGVQTADLTTWAGDENDPNFARFSAAVRRMVDATDHGNQPSPRPTRAWLRIGLAVLLAAGTGAAAGVFVSQRDRPSWTEQEVEACRDRLSRLRTTVETGGDVAVRRGSESVIEGCKSLLDRIEGAQ